MGLVDEQRDAPGLVVGLVVAGLEGAVEELQQQLADEHGVVLADGGFGAGDDEHLAAFEDAFEVERDGVAQERVDLAGGDEAFELVARRVERAGGEAAVGEQGGELAAPVVACEVVAGDLREAAGDALAVGRVAGLEQAVDVPERRGALDRADGRDGLAQEGVRGGLDRAGRVGFDQRVQEDGGAGAGAGVDRQRVDADLGVAEVEVVHRAPGGREAEAELGERTLRVDQHDARGPGRGRRWRSAGPGRSSCRRLGRR